MYKCPHVSQGIRNNPTSLRWLTHLVDTESPLRWGEHVVCKAEAGTFSAKTFRKYWYTWRNSQEGKRSSLWMIIYNPKNYTNNSQMLLAVTPNTDHSFCVTPKPERNIENSAELCLPLVHNSPSAVPIPSLGTIGLNYCLLRTMSTSNTVVHCHTPYTTQNSLYGLKMRVCCPCHPQERAGISGTSSPGEDAADLW